jgi:hypothetical protein
MANTSLERLQTAYGIGPNETPSLTAKDTGTANSGDTGTDDIIDNNRTRIEEIEDALKALGLLA